ncbi:antitoxin [Streptomyces sp. NBC_00435]|uniref:antitoxin n=1 Tax=Streptomyces sp. NBC_00435 TaxID=2903649 RepID=UPI002E1DA1E5
MSRIQHASWTARQKVLTGCGAKPGTYRSTGNGENDNRYWERAKDATGGPDSIIANESPDVPSGRIAQNARSVANGITEGARDMGIFSRFKDQAKDKAKDISDNVEAEVNEKTGNKYADKVDQAQQAMEQQFGIDEDPKK